MDNVTAIKKTKTFTDFYGQDLSDISNLHTKEDCVSRLQEHRRFLEEQHTDALEHIDQFINELDVD